MPLCYAMLCALVCQLFWPFCFNMFVGRRKVYTMHNSLKITATNVENPKINFTSKKQENSSTPSSNAKKVALCGLGVLGTIGATLFAIRRGKASKEIRIGIEEFKQAGNFLKNGKAFTQAGDAFTGELTKISEDGSKFVMKYKDGVLETSTKYVIKDGKLVPDTAKIYKYADDGKLKTVTKADCMYNPHTKEVTYNVQKTTDLETSRQNGLQRAAEAKAARIKEIGKYGADKKVVNGNYVEYYKDGQKIVTERIGDWHETLPNYIDPPHDLQMNNKDINYRYVTTQHHDSGKCIQERLYSTGEKDVLLEGDFNSTFSYIKRLDKDGNVTGYTRTKYLSNIESHPTVHGMRDQTDRILISEFDKNEKFINSRESIHCSTDYTNYDWD